MSQNERTSAVLDLRGLDLVTPVDLIKDGHTPFAKNFRLYAQQSDDRRVAVSSRKGPGYYLNPLSETLSASNTAVVGASTVDVGIITGIHAQPVTAASTGRKTRVDIFVSNPNAASGPLIVELWEDQGGKPRKLLSQSSILNADITTLGSYVTARFLNAPLILSGHVYWIIVRMQDDGKGAYVLSTTSSGTHAWKSNSTISALTAQGYSLNYKVYNTPDMVDKGSYRLNRDNGANVTIVAYGDTMYAVDEVGHTYKTIISGLAPGATEYRFTSGDNRVFWVNAADLLTSWNGLIETDVANSVTNGGFDTNTTGWAVVGSATITRSTATFNTAPASGAITAASGLRGARWVMDLKANHRYKIKFSHKLAASANIKLHGYRASDGIGSDRMTFAGTTSWQTQDFYYTPPEDLSSFSLYTDATDFNLDDVVVKDTGIEYIVDTELPILSDVTFHKDRIFGVSAADPNKMVWSEAPGNPTNLATNKQWYNAWLSTSFWYVPKPHNGSPITGLVSFQDSLTIFTQDMKYIFSGYDKGSFNLRESTGSKGALSRRGITVDENRIYFVGDDGFYEFNGSSDKKISALINPLFDACGSKEMITPIAWKQQVRFYMATLGSPVNDSCVIYNKDLQEYEYDTDTFVKGALRYADADDDNQLIEFSSLYPAAFVAEQGYNSLGAPIDFEYRLKYESMGTPAQRKRIRRFFPLLQGVDSTFNIQLGMDKDFEDSPRLQDMLLSTNGSKWGEFKWGDGTLWGSNTSFKMQRVSYSGYANYWQFRVLRKAVNNRVAFIGVQYSYKTKRL
jgi:hypothetical protein